MTFVNSTIFLISWSPPFTLEGVPIFNYYVTIKTTDGESEQLYTEHSTLWYQPVQGTTYIMITVVAINQAGPGQLASLSDNFSAPSTCKSLTKHNLLAEEMWL